MERELSNPEEAEQADLRVGSTLTAHLEAALQDPTQPGVLCQIVLDNLNYLEIAAGGSVRAALVDHVHTVLLAALTPREPLFYRGCGRFFIIFDGLTEREARRRVEGLLATICAARLLSRDNWYVAMARAGLVPAASVWPSTVERALQMAEVACMAARTNHGGQMTHAAEAGSDPAVLESQVRLMCDLPSALDEGRMKLYAQEIQALTPAAVAPEGRQYELLVHLVDRTGGEHPPTSFISMAERSGMIEMLDRWVVRAALVGHADLFKRAPQVSVSINLSGQSLSNPDLWPFLSETIRKSGMSAARIQFEITETLAIDDVGAAQANLRAARAAGCRVALDDFGAGLSGLAYLKNFEVDCIKIDGDLVKNIANPQSIETEIVRSVCDLGRRLGMTVVAEHVHESGILAALRAMSVDKVQGLLIAKPELLQDILEKSVNSP